MAKSSQCENIEGAWVEAGMHILGNSADLVRSHGVGLVSFDYYVYSDVACLRDRMFTIATEADCYLILNYKEPNARRGRATFILCKELLEWVRILNGKMDGLAKSFAYMQEDPAAMDAADALREAQDLLEIGITKAKDGKSSHSNAETLGKHIRAIQLLRIKHGDAVDLPESKLFIALLGWDYSFNR